MTMGVRGGHDGGSALIGRSARRLLCGPSAGTSRRRTTQSVNSEGISASNDGGSRHVPRRRPSLRFGGRPLRSHACRQFPLVLGAEVYRWADWTVRRCAPLACESLGRDDVGARLRALPVVTGPAAAAGVQQEVRALMTEATEPEIADGSAFVLLAILLDGIMDLSNPDLTDSRAQEHAIRVARSSATGCAEFARFLGVKDPDVIAVATGGWWSNISTN